MASKTSSSRAWFFPTSPRSPYKLQGELRLLKQLEGKVWNPDTQIEYAHLLMGHPEFDGEISKTDPAFSGRDRATRTPRLLGFVHFPKRGKKGPFKFTDIGNLFLEASEEEQILIFQRQLAKVQFCSPLHSSGGFEMMTVKPLMVMIKLLNHLGSMNKEEVALFGNTLTNHKNFESHLKTALSYREKLKSFDNPAQRKVFRKDFAYDWVKHIYQDDIDEGRTKLREGGDDFLKTKYQTLRDYADSTIRYLRATGLFTISPHGQRLMLLNSATEDAQFLLDKYGIGLSEYTHREYDDYVEIYLGNASLPVFRKDDPTLQEHDLSNLLSELQKNEPAKAQSISEQYSNAKSKVEKLQVLANLENQLANLQIQNEAKSIRDDLKSSLVDIKDAYSAITSRASEILDRPLMYEWNTWRALVLINDAKNVLANYTSDTDGNPVSTAGGNKPDIYVEYDSFHLIVEVTLSNGRKQYEMEGEPITRHLGEFQKNVVDNGDTKPVFGIFVAETINENVLNYLLTQARFRSQVWRGTVRFVPMSRVVFESFMESALSHPKFSNYVLRNFFESLFTPESIALGEFEWLALIESKIESFSKLQAYRAA